MYSSGLSDQASTIVLKRLRGWYVCLVPEIGRLKPGEIADDQFWRDYNWFLDRNPFKEKEATAFAHKRVKEQDRK